MADSAFAVKVSESEKVVFHTLATSTHMLMHAHTYVYMHRGMHTCIYIHACTHRQAHKYTHTVLVNQIYIDIHTGKSTLNVVSKKLVSQILQDLKYVTLMAKGVLSCNTH